MTDRAVCEGSGLVADGGMYRNTICPVCRGIAQVDWVGDEERISEHTVLVIDCGGDDEEEATWKIIRLYEDDRHEDHRKVIAIGLTKEEAREHCNHPDTSGDGWFDGMEQE